MASWLSRFRKSSSDDSDSNSPAEELRHRFQEVAQDLLTLEVNTVVKDNMTARKMPPIPIALLEIAAEYYWYIIELNEQWRAPEVETRLQGLEPENRRNSPETFDALREASALLMQTMRQAPPASPEEEDRRAAQIVILDRIYRNASTFPRLIRQLAADNPPAALWNGRRADLLEAYEAAAAVRVSPPQLSVIRKTWDIGTATVALQSTMQLDGDIVTSIQKSYAGAEFKALHDMHLNGTRLSIETWETVVRLVIHIISGVASSFSRLLRGR